jgi:ribosome maturation factor RimP
MSGRKPTFLLVSFVSVSLMKSTSLEQVRENVERIVESEGMELVDAQLLGGGIHRVFRLFIDRSTGVTHDDCEKVSRLVSEYIDSGDLIPGGAYTLEVSSPGVERPLIKPKDFQRFIGSKVKLELKQAIEKSRRFTGKLAAFDGERVTLELEPGKNLEVAFDAIQKANLKYEW